MWEKELLGKFKKKYTSHYSMMYGGTLIAKKFDRRDDDRVLTPKKGKSVEQKQNKILKQIKQARNLKTKYCDKDPYDLSDDKNTPIRPCDSVTIFPNHKINPITLAHQENYEENEAVSPHSISHHYFLQLGSAGHRPIIS